MVAHVDLLHLPISHLSQPTHTWGVTDPASRALAHKAQVRRLIFLDKKVVLSKYLGQRPASFLITFTQSFTGVISPGLSVPLQVPGQTHADITSNYWPRL